MLFCCQLLFSSKLCKQFTDMLDFMDVNLIYVGHGVSKTLSGAIGPDLLRFNQHTNVPSSLRQQSFDSRVALSMMCLRMGTQCKHRKLLIANYIRRHSP